MITIHAKIELNHVSIEAFFAVGFRKKTRYTSCQCRNLHNHLYKEKKSELYKYILFKKDNTIQYIHNTEHFSRPSSVDAISRVYVSGRQGPRRCPFLDWPQVRQCGTVLVCTEWNMPLLYMVPSTVLNAETRARRPFPIVFRLSLTSSLSLRMESSTRLPSSVWRVLSDAGDGYGRPAASKSRWTASLLLTLKTKMAMSMLYCHCRIVRFFRCHAPDQAMQRFNCVLRYPHGTRIQESRGWQPGEKGLQFLKNNTHIYSLVNSGCEWYQIWNEWYQSMKSYLMRDY